MRWGERASGILKAGGREHLFPVGRTGTSEGDRLLPVVAAPDDDQTQQHKEHYKHVPLKKGP